ncbi:hypothetical protein BU15DRAFT_67322 [Melanogaster broomeanus]|nr:hypothetical protein BU15DRAFT_67322 [Melanogaster broomeanus]
MRSHNNDSPIQDDDSPECVTQQHTTHSRCSKVGSHDDDSPMCMTQQHTHPCHSQPVQQATTVTAQRVRRRRQTQHSWCDKNTQCTEYYRTEDTHLSVLRCVHVVTRYGNSWHVSHYGGNGCAWSSCTALGILWLWFWLAWDTPPASLVHIRCIRRFRLGWYGPNVTVYGAGAGSCAIGAVQHLRRKSSRLAASIARCTVLTAWSTISSAAVSVAPVPYLSLDPSRLALPSISKTLIWSQVLSL